MGDLKYKPVGHGHDAFLKKVSKHPGFASAFEALDVEYGIVSEMLSARRRAGLTQEVVAERMGTTKSAISRLEAAGKHAPSLASLKKYAAAVGCTLRVELIPAQTRRGKVKAARVRTPSPTAS